MSIFVRLLGTPAVCYQEEWLELPIGFPSALLYHLAYKNTWVTRERLAFIFWPDVLESNSRKNLRNLLPRVRDLEFTEDLEVERNRIRWKVKTDIAPFHEAANNKHFENLVDLYKGELLEGFHLDNALEFNNWLEFEREGLKGTYQRVLLSQISEFEANKNFAEAAEQLEQLRKTDPLDEDILRRQLQNFHIARQPKKASLSFKQFRTLLKKEYGAEPELATLELFEAIEQSQKPVVSIKPTVEIEHKAEFITPNNLPAQLTPFLGREIELKRIAEQLSDPDCRLLTLVAPGGMGKTSLALKAAREQLNQFKDGIWFVPFVSISHPEQMLYAITDALNLFSTQQDLKTHLHSFLKDKKLLLVLDNLEHLTSGLTLISELLENAAGIKVLATSREQLQLRAEWLFDLSGLSYPATNNLDNAKTYDAVELFLQKAERIDSEINSEQLNLQEITRICQLVEGMPLAIELAASWLRILTLEEILSELEQGINLLEASIRDTPERHQSIRAVFDYSWHLLNTTQQRSLTALSVFRGGFARDAAQHVSGVTVRGLLELVSKSLLRRNQSGRFDFHPLIRQYAEEKARRTLELHIKTIAKHASFYLELMHGQVERLKQGQQKEALETMDQDIENIKQAWLWAINHNEVNSLIQLCDAMQIYHGQRNKISEGISVFEMLIDNLDASKTKNRVAIGRALVSQGWLTYRLAAYEKAIQLSQKAIDLFQAENNFQGIMRALNTMGVSHRRLGRLEPARVCLSEAVKLAKDQDSQRLQANYMQNLANLELEEGKVKQAEALYSQAQSLQQALNNHRAVVSLLLNRSLLLEHQGRFKESKSLQLEGLKLARQMNFQQTLPYLLNGLGQSCIKLTEYETAHASLGEALDMVQYNGDNYLHIIVLTNLAVLASKEGKTQKLESLFCKALQIAQDPDSYSEALFVLTKLATYWSKQNRIFEALTLLYFILDDEVTVEKDKPSLQLQVNELQVQLPEGSTDEVMKQAGSLDIVDFMSKLINGGIKIAL